MKNIQDIIKRTVRNGSAILFPYLRSIVTDITSKGKHSPIVLPTLNFYKLIEDCEPSELIISNDEYIET